MGKFKSLTHNGVIFPESWQPKKWVDILGSALAEEMLYKFAALKETDYVKDAVFVKNFWKCLKPELKKDLQKKSFPEDFNNIIIDMFNFNEDLKEEKKKFRKENKAILQADKDALKEQYGFAMLDGVKTPLSNFMIEGPGIMMARGNSPLRGLWKYEVKPEDIVINWVGDIKKAPKPPKGHTWKNIVSNTNAFVTATYEVNVGNVYNTKKKIQFSDKSSVKSNHDMEKFAKVERLVKDWDNIQAYIDNGLKSKDPKTREAALVSWLILNTGIRIGNERDEVCQATDVSGASTLLVRNVKIK